MVITFSILSGLFIIASFNQISWTVLFIVNGFVLLFSLLDLMLSPNKKDIKVTRNIPTDMERGLDYPFQITVQNPTSFDMYCEIIDAIPQSFHRPFPLRGIVPKGNNKKFTYKTTAPVRGEYTVEKIYVRYSSLFGLWKKEITFQQKMKIKVIPDLTESKQYLENAQKFLLHDGVQIKRLNSGAGEFAKIRSYVVGDDPRKINWRQTAKLQEVMTNEFEPEHGKYVTILIDCGRMMGAELKKGNRLEKSLEAAITVATAALHKGDYVSVVAFSKKVKVYIPPGKGMAHLQTILQAIYKIEVDAVESNYAEVFTYLQLVQKKRSLILLFSDIKTFLYEESALIYLKRVRSRHLFLMIGVEDQTLQLRAKQEPADLEKAMIKQVAQQQLLFKKKEKQRWEKNDLLMMEAKEERLAASAVSHYIETLNKGLL